LEVRTMTMALFSAEAETPESEQRWCICRLCVDGFGIPFDINGEEYRVCGELCAVGRPLSHNDCVASASVKAAAATPPLRCNICGVEVKLSSFKPCVSDDENTYSDN